MRVLVMVLLLMLVCDGHRYAQVPGFSVDVTWAGSKSCFDPQSPPFPLNGIPAGTRKLRFTMTDLDAPNSVQGGGTMVHDGQRSVPQGAFSVVRVRLAVSIAIDGQFMPTQLRSGRPMVVVALAQQDPDNCWRVCQRVHTAA